MEDTMLKQGAWNGDERDALVRRRRQMSPEEIETDAMSERNRMAAGEMSAVKALDPRQCLDARFWL
jgi:hypothetical protein